MIDRLPHSMALATGWGLATAVALLLAPPALGDPLPGRPPAEPEWYGWQTLLADGVSVGAIGAGMAVASSGEQTPNLPGLSLAGLGALGYFLAAPTVHWARGNTSNGFVSLALRAGSAAGTVGGAAGCFTFAHGGGGGSGLLCGVMVVSIVGIVATIPIDAALIARDPAREGGFSVGPLRDLAVTVLPPDGDGAALAVRGRF